MLLDITGLNVSYGKTRVLWNVSLGIESLEIVVVAGSNGAGKSTLLKSICGVKDTDGGTICFNGMRIDGLPTHRIVSQGISLIPEGGRVFPSMTVEENLDLGGYQERSIDRKQKSIEWVFQLFPVLREKRNQRARTLSGGQRQMLAVGIGLVPHPKVLLIDEPSSGLAPKLVKSLFRMIEEIRTKGIAVLLVEQNVRAALEIAERGYVLENGRMILEGTSKDLKTNDHVKKAYLGI